MLSNNIESPRSTYKEKKKNQPECYKRKQNDFPPATMQDSQIFST